MPFVLLTTAVEVVDHLGGIEAVCELTRSNDKAVYHWTGRVNQFPARTYKVLKDELRRKKATAPDKLWNMIPSKKKKRARNGAKAA